VPPRRTKRKVKTASSETKVETGSEDAGFQRKRPPPLPPPPEKYPNGPRFAIENRSRCDVAKCEEDVDERKFPADAATISIDADKSARSRDRTMPARKGSTTNSNNDEPVLRSPFASYRDIVESERTSCDEHPPLFFTLRDFNAVMSATHWSNSVNENLKDTRSSAHSEMHGSRETRGMLDDGEDVCFRVTTTNLPFGKCLGGSEDRFGNDAFARKFDCPYDDGANDRARRSSDNSDNGGDSEHRAGTKVRFAIEPTSLARCSSNRDGKIDLPCDSPRSCESILGDERVDEQSVASSAQLLIREELAKVADRSDDSRDQSRALNVSEKNFAMEKENDPSTLAGANNADAMLEASPETHCYGKSNGINYEKTRRWDSSSISWSEHVACENLRIENKATSMDEAASEKRPVKQMDQKKKMSVASLEIAEHARPDESTETACRNEEANAAEIIERRTQGEKTFPEKFCTNEDRVESEKVLIGEPLGKFLNADDATRDKFAIGSSRRLSIDDLANKSPALLVSRRSLIEERRTRNIVYSKNDYEEASPDETFAKNVPAKIRRDFFLETMLADHPMDVSIECTVISTRAVLLSPSVNGELSRPSESTRELDADSARERKRSYAFDETIKAHTKNKKVPKDVRETRGRTADIPSADAKSTKSWNKSAGDAKNDVLNELLYSFDNIKLKIVSPENKRPATRIGDEENIIARPVAVDSGISAENGDASFEQHTLEECRDEARDETKLEPSIEIARLNDDAAATTSCTGIMKKALTETKPVIDGELARSESVAITGSRDAESKFARVGRRERIAGSDRARSRIEKTSKSRENEVSERESRKSQDVRIPETILEKKSAECEQTKQFQKRIPIGPPATVNKIFDSRELETIADTSRGGSLHVEKRAGVVSREAHSRVEEKTDKGTNDEADADARRIASRPALSLAGDAASSEDKCAITRGTTSVTPCNNNDNNNRAVTGVVSVSNDQSSCDVVTITPGKVRSFVKYYEIRGDAITVEGHSKINDREKVAKRKSRKKRAAPIVTRSPRRPEIMAEGGDVGPR